MKVAVIVMLVLCLAMASGCRGRRPLPPPVKPKPPVVVPPAQPERGRVLVAKHTGDLDPGSRSTVVRAACMANDMVDVAEAPNFGEAVRRAWINFGGYRTLFYRIQGLAEDLRNASTVSERRNRVGVFVVCESY